ncbi:glutamic acid-rich protein-like [Neocloeon triangulifer]|uniref:glutamic acid-rich protein-like n=1 Tax=Neocloeon triangulifer TaxID=2078957 RepID=UPI00286F818B|nr:glutamic acid-rich protein-like [Neocloeon triangulifer]
MKELKRPEAITQTLPGGWHKRIYLRVTGASAGKKDVVLIAPDETVLRSNVEIERYCKAHKLKLDLNVYNVCQKLVKNVFKKEAAALMKEENSNKTPGRPHIKENKKDAPKSVKGKAKTKPKKSKSSRKSAVLSERRRNQSGDAVTTKRKMLESPTVVDPKRPKMDVQSGTTSLTSRQTRNSLAAALSPAILAVKGPSENLEKKQKAKKTDEKLEEQNKEEEKGDVELSEDEKDDVELEEDEKVEEHHSELKDGDDYEIDFTDDLAAVEEVTTTNSEVMESTNEGKMEAGKVLFEEKKVNGTSPEAEDYELPMDDVELALDDTNFAKVENPEPVSANVEQKHEQEGSAKIEDVVEEETAEPERCPSSASTDSDKIIVINSKDLDKIDQTCIKLFVLPEEGDLPEEVPSGMDINAKDEGTAINVVAEEVVEKLQTTKTNKILSENNVLAKDGNLPESKVLETPEKEPAAEDEAVKVEENPELSEVVVEVENETEDAGKDQDVEDQNGEMINEDVEDEEEILSINEADLEDSDDDSEEEMLEQVETVLKTCGYLGGHTKEEATADTVIGDEMVVKEDAVIEDEVEKEDTVIEDEMPKEDSTEPVNNIEQEETLKSVEEGGLTEVDVSVQQQTEQLPMSPFHLIYESLGTDPWCLLVASIIQPHVTAQVGQVVTLGILERFPTVPSFLEVSDLYSIPECEMDQKVPWVLGQLKKLALLLKKGAILEELEEIVGTYGVNVLEIFNLGRLELRTKAHDLIAYLKWRQEQTR